VKIRVIRGKRTLKKTQPRILRHPFGFAQDKAQDRFHELTRKNLLVLLREICVVRSKKMRGTREQEKMQTQSVHVIFYREDDYYVAHCLEFDLVAQGQNLNDAFKNLLDAIELQATYALESDDPSILFNPAPAEYWRMLGLAEGYTPEPNGWRLPAIVSRVDCAVVTT
jgi:predicted RNase H-like HicB family nuclease